MAETMRVTKAGAVARLAGLAEVRSTKAGALGRLAGLAKVRSTKAGALVRLTIAEMRATQAGALVRIAPDGEPSNEVRSTQAGVVVRIEPPQVRTTQAGVLVRIEPPEVRSTQAGVLVRVEPPHVRSTQAGVLVRIETPHMRSTQVGALGRLTGLVKVRSTKAGALGRLAGLVKVRSTKAGALVRLTGLVKVRSTKAGALVRLTILLPASGKTDRPPAPAPAKGKIVSPAAAKAGNQLFTTLAASLATVAPTTILATGGAQTVGGGMSTTRQVNITVEVDWARTGAWFNESNRVISAQGQHSLVAPDALLAGGRGAVATARVMLANDDGRYSLGNPYSPLDIVLSSGVTFAPVRIHVTVDGVAHRIFTGVIRELNESGGTATESATVTLECRGREEILLNDLRSTLLVNFLADNSQAHTEDFHIVRLLEMAGMVDGTDFVTRSYAAAHPGVRATIDNGIFPIRYVWLDEESVLDQIWEMVAACGGWFYCDADGKLHYHNLTTITSAALTQHYGAQTTLWLDQTNLAGIMIARPARELYSDVTVEVMLRQPLPSAEIWKPDAPIVVQPGVSSTIWATLSAPLASTPTLMATAVNAYGATLPEVTVTPTYYTQRVKLVLSNPTNQIAYFTASTMHLNGQLLDSATSLEIEENSAASFWNGRPRRRRRIKQNAYIQSDTQAQTLARYFLRRQERPQPHVSAQNVDRPDIRLGHPVQINYQDAIIATPISGIVAGLDWRCDRNGFRQNIAVLETDSLMASHSPFFVLGTHRLGASGVDTAYLFY